MSEKAAVIPALMNPDDDDYEYDDMNDDAWAQFLADVDAFNAQPHHQSSDQPLTENPKDVSNGIATNANSVILPSNTSMVGVKKTCDEMEVEDDHMKMNSITSENPLSSMVVLSSAPSVNTSGKRLFFFPGSIAMMSETKKNH